MFAAFLGTFIEVLIWDLEVFYGLPKFVERIIAEQWKYLNDYSVLPPIYWGFGYGFSFTITLLNIADDVIQALDERKCTVLMALNFSKAFDSINHLTLLLIIKSCGISYVLERIRVVKWNILWKFSV